ncbi:30S ribosomal protein S1 [Lacicoccus alkaliphilus]|uniref:Small subunit ribosomal protein S1 n=1 Tax=Lacicoccus alkaliphilus DSM 16010 TaxID=1123231 RepID=A0A1M7BBJ1_9BACL|nr:30S ribosomal protein S1 [Salinicoccus alkaliphilus]SHL52352.1 small subunit ribosomal protein S1 [Salinicoccus alkaliphilus DSM 16010]
MTADNILNEENNEKNDELENSQVEVNSPEEENQGSQEQQSQEDDSTSGGQDDSEAASEGSDVSFNEGDKVTGTVFKVEDKFVRAHIDGSDFEGIIPISQVTNKRIEHPNEVVAEDDSIEAVVIKVEDENERHNLILSIRKLEEDQSYDSLITAKENDETLEGTVMEVVQAGLVVDVGVRGFIPASLLSDEYVEDLEQFAGQTLEVKVEDIDKDKNRVILNRKKIIESQKNDERRGQLQKLTADTIVEGEVVRTTNFGAFINLGAIDGLAHISELSYERVEKVEDAVNIGDKVDVKILDVDVDNERVSLSIKQAQASPFELFIKEHDEGETLEGTVKRLVDFGAFVEVAPGVEGLVHVSEISHDHVAQPADVLDEGEKIQVKILSLNADAEKVSLSIKETTDPGERSTAPSKVYRDETEDDRPTLGDVFGDRFKNLDL